MAHPVSTADPDRARELAWSLLETAGRTTVDFGAETAEIRRALLTLGLVRQIGPNTYRATPLGRVVLRAKRTFDAPIICPGCQKTRPRSVDEARQSDYVYCCNPRCRGRWGTGCYHCHSPTFWSDHDARDASA